MYSNRIMKAENSDELIIHPTWCRDYRPPPQRPPAAVPGRVNVALPCWCCSLHINIQFRLSGDAHRNGKLAHCPLSLSLPNMRKLRCYFGLRAQRCQKRIQSKFPAKKINKNETSFPFPKGGTEKNIIKYFSYLSQIYSSWFHIALWTSLRLTVIISQFAILIE